jgi:VCBS repeat-containing protein
MSRHNLEQSLPTLPRFQVFRSNSETRSTTSQDVSGAWRYLLAHLEVAVHVLKRGDALVDQLFQNITDSFEEGTSVNVNRIPDMADLLGDSLPVWTLGNRGRCALLRLKTQPETQSPIAPKCHGAWL